MKGKDYKKSDIKIYSMVCTKVYKFIVVLFVTKSVLIFNFCICSHYMTLRCTGMKEEKKYQFLAHVRKYI